MKEPATSLPDTNVIVRYLTNDDPGLFARARDYFDKVKNNETTAIILESVIAECIYVLTKIYRVPRDKAAQSLIDLLRYRGVVNKDKKELIEALMLFSTQSPAIVHCILYAKARGGEYRLFSFDADPNKLK